MINENHGFMVMYRIPKDDVIDIEDCHEPFKRYETVTRKIADLSDIQMPGTILE